MRCTPIIHELIVLTLPTRHRCPLTWLPASRLLLPRSGLERSDFVLCVDTDVAGFIWDKSGAASLRKFTTSRYIVKMEPATEYGLKQSRVTDTTWGVLGHSLQ